MNIFILILIGLIQGIIWTAFGKFILKLNTIQTSFWSGAMGSLTGTWLAIIFYGR